MAIRLYGPVTITYDGHYFDEPVTIQLGRRNWERESVGDRHCVDVMIRRQLALDCPLLITASIRTDGSVVECGAEWQETDNTYWHLCAGSADVDRRGELTQAQRETLIRIWGGQVRPFGVRGTCGGPVMAWVNASRAEVEAILDRKVYLTAPCDDRQEIMPSGASRPADESPSEALLELAVEEGRMGGALPADI